MTTKGSDSAAWAVSSMPLFGICMTTEDNLDAGLRDLIFAWDNWAYEFNNSYEWICPPLQQSLKPFFVGKEYSAYWTGLHVNWTAWKLDCMGIGLHGHWTARELDRMCAWLGRSRTACWSRGLHAGTEDCDPLGLVHVLNRQVEREFIRPVTATTA